jgi:capsular exopolysaccharide synthesis family protein
MNIDKFDFLGYWRILVRRRWTIHLAVATAGMVALIGAFLTTPQYRATATVQIARYGPDILDHRDLSRADYSWSAFDHFYQTQYTILASRPVARLAAERLGLDSHPAFDTGQAAGGLVARVKRMIPRKQRAHAEVDALDAAAARVLGGLEVLPISRSFLVQVSWVNADPELAAEVANAVAESYIQFTLQSRFSTTDQAKDFLVDQTATLKREIAAIEERLQEYAEAKKILGVDESNNLTLQALAEISTQRTAADTALARALARHEAVRNATPESLPEVLQSGLIDRLRAEYAAYEAEYSEKSETFKDDWPGLQTLRSKLEQARERLEIETSRIVEQVRAAAAAEYDRARNEAQNLDLLVARHERAAQRLKRDAVEYNSLLSEVRKKREALDALLRRENEIALSTRLQDLDATSGNITIVERATPPAAPFYPDTAMAVGVGVLLGLLAGSALAFFLEYVDNTIGSAQELEGLLSIPVLAIIPRHGASAGAAPLGRARRGQAGGDAEPIYLVPHRDSHAGVSEAYRALRTSILLTNPGRPPRQIVVTSAHPGEGKTATAVNLAIVLAQLDRRVLIVDADLRRPRLHYAFGIENRVGVSTFLSGQKDDASGLVRATRVPGLEALTSGPIPPNPSELLNSPIFARLGHELLERGYDHVVFDTPPVLSVSDPVIVSSVADTGILVVRAGSTPKQSVRAAADRLLVAASCPFGAVLNGFDAETHGYRYEAYYHEYAPEERESRRASSA